jgi:ABC-type glutathione transport system ATPase component
MHFRRPTPAAAAPRRRRRRRRHVSAATAPSRAHRRPRRAQNVSYTVINSQNKKEKISLLQSVTGYLKPGDMAALMGPSGSGERCFLVPRWLAGGGHGWACMLT